jgi:hypothetical protein
MNDELPTDAQVRSIEDRVMTRIRRRARLPHTIASTVLIAGLVVGGFALLRPGPATTASGGSAASESRRDAAPAAAALCHASSHASCAAQSVPARGKDSTAAALEACERAWREDRIPGSRDDAFSGGGPRLVACRDPAGELHVFVRDRSPSTLCSRNGMATP